MNLNDNLDDEVNAAFDAAVLVHDRTRLSPSLDGLKLCSRIFERLSQHFKELQYLRSLEPDVIIEKIKLEYE